MAREQFFTRYRPEFDGLRGLACLIVLVGHAVAINVPASFVYLRGVPKIGVWLFFSLSAFLLSQRLLDSGFSGRAIAFYAYARALRIIPLFVLATLFYFWIGMFGMQTVHDAMAVLFFQKAAGHLWTIPVELGFYVILPALLFACTLASAPWKRVLVAVGICGVALAIWPPWRTPENSLFVGWYLSAFIPSVVAAIVPRSAGRGWMVGVTLIAATLYALSVKSGLAGDWKLGLVDKFYVYGILFAFTVYGLYTSDSIWNRVFSNRALVIVGEASFSIYLFHWAIVHWMRLMPPLFAMPTAIAVSIVVGVISCRFIEMPLYALRKKAPFATGSATTSNVSV